MDTVLNPLFALLNDQYKKSANDYIGFLYCQQEEIEPGDETAEVIQAALRGEGIIGSFGSIDELFKELNA